MLRALHIQGFALIERAEVAFEGGLNILSGETGAGKSILLDALGLVLGGRGDRDYIRSGCDRAIIDAEFDLSGMPQLEASLSQAGVYPQEHALLLGREIQDNGRSICRINGAMTTLNMLKQITTGMIEVHGQHEHQLLLDPANHRSFLDAFCGEDVLKKRSQLKEIHAAWREAEKQLREQQMDVQQRERMIDMLQFQTQEIAAAKLDADEEAQLTAQRDIQRYAQRIKQAIYQAYRLLYDHGDQQSAALEQIGQACSELEGIISIHENYQQVYQRIQDSYYVIEDAITQAKGYAEELDADATLLEDIEERLELIAKLKRKYGATVEEVLAFYEQSAEQLEQLEHIDSRRQKLEGQVAALTRELYEHSRQLSQMRREGAKRFEREVLSQLADLGFEKAVFTALVDFPSVMPQSGYQPEGLDKVEFLFSPNPGQSAKPMSKIISGGELSRVMLALKHIVAHLKGVPTMLFDEIDSGVSGKMAQAVAQKLAAIAKNHQVICVTHLPQIAAMADHHFLIEKESDGQSTHTRVTRLDVVQRQGEIARLVGDIGAGSAGWEHAGELLTWCERYREAL